jgi:hypothetical protein
VDKIGAISLLRDCFHSSVKPGSVPAVCAQYHQRIVQGSFTIFIEPRTLRRQP